VPPAPDRPERRVVTYAELDARADAFAAALAPFVSGECLVALSIPRTDPDLFAAQLGVLKAGAAFLCLDAAFPDDHLRAVIADAAPVALVASDVARCARLFDGTVLDPAELSPAPAPATPHFAPERLAYVIYTSGTTGAPKGVVNRYRSAVGPGAVLGGFYQPDDMLYTCLPLFHANALLLSTVRGLTMGLPVVLSRRFSASRIWDEMRRYGATTFNALGAMIPILMKQPERPNDADNPVRIVFSAACPASVWEAFEKRFAVRIIEGYGAVDGAGFGVVNMGNAPRGSFGKPTSPYRIVDEDDNDVPVGQPGELLFQVDDAKLRKVEFYKNPVYTSGGDLTPAVNLDFSSAIPYKINNVNMISIVKNLHLGLTAKAPFWFR